MTMNRITDESLNQLIAIESLANDNAHEDRRIADQIYHAGIVAALEELRERREASVMACNELTGVEAAELLRQEAARYEYESQEFH